MKGDGDTLGDNFSDSPWESSRSSVCSFVSRSIYSTTLKTACCTVFSLVLLLRLVVGNPWVFLFLTFGFSFWGRILVWDKSSISFPSLFLLKFPFFIFCKISRMGSSSFDNSYWERGSCSFIVSIFLFLPLRVLLPLCCSGVFSWKWILTRIFSIVTYTLKVKLDQDFYQSMMVHCIVYELNFFFLNIH